MMLLEYRCADGHVTERLVARDDADAQRCSCGASMKRLWSSFGQAKRVIDLSDWHLVAPLDADGRPMTLAETAKSGKYEQVRPGSAERERQRREAEQERRSHQNFQKAKNMAWAEVSRRNRITIRST